MKLTGKCKEEFEKYSNYLPSEFWKLPLEMQIGVLILYFDSVGNHFDVYRKQGCYESNNNGYLGAWSTRKEAWTQAIEKANEIRNEQLK